MKSPASADSTTTGPEYVSGEEWRLRARQRRAHFRRYSVLLAILCLFIVVGYCYLRIASLEKLRNGLVSKLTALGKYEVKVYRPTPSGGMELWRTEIHEGRDWEVQLFGGQVTFSKIGHAYYCHTANPDRTLASHSWTGLTPIVPRLVAQVNDLNFTKFYDKSRQLRLARSPAGGWAYRYSDGDETYSLVFDRSGRFPVRTETQGPGIDGEDTIERAEFSYRQDLRIHPVTATRPLQQTGGVIRKISVENNPPLLIRSADANTLGDCFFEISGFHSQLPFHYVLKNGQQFYYISLSPSFDKTWVFEYMQEQGGKAAWPISVELSLPVEDPIGKVSFQYTFQKPTCFLLPDEISFAHSDAQYLEYMQTWTSRREDFLENTYSDASGTVSYAPVSVRAATGLAPVVSDRLEAITENEKLLVMDRELQGNSNEGLRDRLQCWIACGMLLKAFGDSNKAHNAFRAALSLIRHHPPLDQYESILQANAASVNVDLAPK